jgi:hypothetical protein
LRRLSRDSYRHGKVTSHLGYPAGMMRCLDFSSEFPACLPGRHFLGNKNRLIISLGSCDTLHARLTRSILHSYPLSSLHLSLPPRLLLPLTSRAFYPLAYRAPSIDIPKFSKCLHVDNNPKHILFPPGFLSILACHIAFWLALWRDRMDVPSECTIGV